MSIIIVNLNLLSECANHMQTVTVFFLANPCSSHALSRLIMERPNKKRHVKGLRLSRKVAMPANASAQLGSRYFPCFAF